MAKKKVRKGLPIASSGKRITIAFILIAFLISLAGGRAFLIQGIDADANAQAAAAELTRTQVLRADRGLIVDRNGTHLAETQPAFLVAADPSAVSTNGKNPESMTEEDWATADEAPAEMAKILVRYLGGSTSEYEDKLSDATNADGSPKMYVVLKRQVSAAVYQELATALDEAGWYGVYAHPDPIRYYPNGQLAANVVGFVNSEGEGAGGFEYTANETLRGVDGTQTYQISRYGTIPLGDNALVEPQNGANYQLTIDADLQWMAENHMVAVAERHNAASATAIVMAVDTGEILAMATAPSFDPNHPEEASNDNLGNRAITDAYEPGSVHKVLTFAAALDSGVITPDTRFQVPGSIESGGGVINDAWAHGTEQMTARGILARSSNTGSVQVARMVGKETLHGYLTDFGLGQPTGIELPGEPDGALGYVPPADMPDYSLDQISFGQGLSVTALQEATAVAAVTNGGIYHQPTIVANAQTADGDTIEIERPEPRRVISQEASAGVLNMMEASVASPEMTTLDANTIEGYRMAGKSGTSQKIGEYGNYDGGYVGSYVAVAPVEDPQILVYVVVDEPTNGYYGAQVAFPAARALMTQALPRYGIAPSTSIPEYTDPLS